ncbi:MAG: glycosyltransferase [Saprospiraceae bacterium]|nr:glycosyltransferase [Saprospiraceae bacterium]
MKILQLCNKFPFPLKDGAAIASTYMAKAFAGLGHEVTLLSMNTSKHWFDTQSLPADFDHYQAIHTVFVDNRIKPMPALINLFSKKSYHITRFESAEFEKKLREILMNDHFDAVLLESVYLAPYIQVVRAHAPGTEVVLRAHNVEHEIWERVAAQSNPLKKWYLQTITPRLKQYETERINDCDMVVAISDRDAAAFKALGLRCPVTVAPIGIDTRDYMPDEKSFQKQLSLSFIGSLDWMPNQEGLKWFLDEVWQPVLAPEFPELTFHIGGRTAPWWLRTLQMHRVVFHGEVPSAPDFLNQHSIMVVPLLSGGGMRAKILEGMALGKVVLSTRLGMEGIEASDGNACLLADTPEQWLQAVKWCYEQGEELAKIGRKARNFCVNQFDNREVARQLVADMEANGKRGQSIATDTLRM